MKQANPEYGVGDIAKELGRKWSDVDPEVKSRYEAMAEKDKSRYEKVSQLQFKSIPSHSLTDQILCIFAGNDGIQGTRM